MEKLLLYNVKNPQDIIKTASNMRIVCGFINESDADKTLAELASGVRGISLSDAAEGAADLFVVGKDLENFVKQLPRVVILDNIMDKTELENKLRTEFEK